MARQIKSDRKSRSKAQRKVRSCFVAAVVSASFAATGLAQITVPITEYQVGTSAPASPNAAYSNITTSLGTTVGGGSGTLSTTVFSNLTASTTFQGQTVQSLRLGVGVRQEVTNPSSSFRCRVQVGFWNADGPNGTAGTPVQGLTGFAQYQSGVLTIPRGEQAIITLELGDSGFVVPSGRLFFGMAYDTTGFAESRPTDFPYSVHDMPAVGTNQPSLFTGTNGMGASLSGIPWGVTFGMTNGPALGALVAPNASLGIELVVPAPSIGCALAFGAAATLRRRRF